MSLYIFDTARLASPRDRKRTPGIDKGQVCRAMIFWLVLAAALLVMSHRQSHAAGYEPLRASLPFAGR